MLKAANWMKSADASCAPAQQSACMTSTCAVFVDTAAMAVSFLLIQIVAVLHLGVRIILPQAAKP